MEFTFHTIPRKYVQLFHANLKEKKSIKCKKKSIKCNEEKKCNKVKLDFIPRFPPYVTSI